MRNLKIFFLVGCLSLVGVYMVPRARADAWNQRTTITFSQPVELPGIVLPAGTYVFELLDSPSSRNIVQVFNKDEDQLLATILAIPDYRLEPTGKTVITFQEQAAGAPEALRAWFYPGSLYGQEFVYPKPRAVELAKANRQHVPSMPAEMAASVKKPVQSPEVKAMKNAPVNAIQPSGQEMQLAQVHQPPKQAQAETAHSSQQAQAKPQSSHTQTAMNKHLPKTASPLPLIALTGILSLAGALALRFFSKRVA